MGSNLEAHYQGSQVIMGLMSIKCAKLNEYSEWVMPKVQSMCPMVAKDPMEKLE